MSVAIHWVIGWRARMRCGISSAGACVPGAAPATVNLELAAIDTLYRSRGIVPPVVERLELPTLAPRALPRGEQIELLRAVERRGSARDAAIAAVLSCTAVRVSECAALDVEDVSLTARTGEVIIRQAKRDEYRRLPLNRAAREATQSRPSPRRARWRARPARTRHRSQG